MRKPKFPGELISKMNREKAHPSKKHHKMHKMSKKHHKALPMSPLTGLQEGSPEDMKMDQSMADKMHKGHPHHKMAKHLHKLMQHLHKHAKKGSSPHLMKASKHLHKAMSHLCKKMPHMKPKGAAGKAQVKKLGRTFKTGGFSKIAKMAGKKYGSKESGKKVAGAIFQRMARKHAGK